MTNECNVGYSLTEIHYQALCSLGHYFITIRTRVLPVLAAICFFTNHGLYQKLFDKLS